MIIYVLGSFAQQAALPELVTVRGCLPCPLGTRYEKVAVSLAKGAGTIKRVILRSLMHGDRLDLEKPWIK